MKRAHWLLACMGLVPVGIIGVVGVSYSHDPCHDQYPSGTAEDVRNFNIPAGALQRGLMCFTHQAGVNALWSGVYENEDRPAIQGRMKAGAALDRLLHGTGVVLVPALSDSKLRILEGQSNIYRCRFFTAPTTTPSEPERDAGE